MRFPDVAVRLKGNATYSPRSVAAVKNSYQIDLNKYVKGQKLAGLSTLNFHNSIADQDHSFGNFPPQPGIHAEGSIFAPTPGRIMFLERMMAVPAFRETYLARMREFSKTLLQPARLAAQVNDIVSVIRPFVVQEPPKLIKARFDADPLTMFDRIVTGQRGLLPFITARAQSVGSQPSK